MARRLRISTEFAFLLSGVFIMVVAWALNLIGTLSGEQEAGHGGSDVYLWLMFMFQGLAFSTVGVVYVSYRELLVNRNLAKRYLVGFLFIADGGLHLLAFNQHLRHPFAAAFFAVVSPIQIVVGMVLPRLSSKLDPFWLLFTGFLIGAFIVTRTVATWPFGVVEEVDPLGVMSKAVEILTVGILISLARGRNSEKRNRQATSPVNGP